MSLYTLALFAHILGVLSLFIGMGLQWTVTLLLRRSQTLSQVRLWSSLVRGTGRLAPVSGVLILAAGIYMMALSWSLSAPWIMVSLAAMVIMMALGMGVTARRLKGIQRAAAAEASADAITPDLYRQVHHPALWISTQMAASTALGIVFMMTNKPGLGGSLLTLAVALALGALVGTASARPRQSSHAVVTHEDFGASTTQANY